MRRAPGGLRQSFHPAHTPGSLRETPGGQYVLAGEVARAFLLAGEVGPAFLPAAGRNAGPHPEPKPIWTDTWRVSTERALGCWTPAAPRFGAPGRLDRGVTRLLGVAARERDGRHKALADQLLDSLHTENRLLASLPRDDFDRLRPLLRTVELSPRQTIHRPAESIQSVYFPITAVLSLTNVLLDGSSMEVGMIGAEGMAGLPALLGAGSTPFGVVVQIAGTAHQMPAATLAAASQSGVALGARLLRYTQAFLDQVAGRISCSRHHTVQQRLASYLLMIRDRVETDRLPLTHELLGHALGVGRPSVTLTVDALQRAGVVRLGRGSVTITDLPALEEIACECYRSAVDDYARLLH